MMRPNVRLGGVLGEALEANRAGRLSHFITGEASPAVALFSPEHRGANREGDWYGEHAGKWLSAAARAASRGDAELAARVKRVAGYLASVQEADGYLGTYAPERRFTVKQSPPRQSTWDGAPSKRTWDIWVHSYLILGLLEGGSAFNCASVTTGSGRSSGQSSWRQVPFSTRTRPGSGPETVPSPPL